MRGLVWFCVMTVGAVACGGHGDRGSVGSAGSAGGADEAAVEVPPNGLVEDMHGDISATAPDGSFAIARGQTLSVYAPDAAGRFDRWTMRMHAPVDDNDVRYGVAGSRVVMTGKDKHVDVLDARANRTVATITAEQLGDDANWGDPQLVGDRVLTFHQNKVSVWDVDTHQLRCAITDPLITLAREAFPLGGNRVAIRSGQDDPSPANVVLVVAEIDGCTVRDVLVTAQVAAAGGGLLVGARDQTIQIFGADRATLEPRTSIISALAVDPHGERIVWGDAAGGVAVWTRKTARLVWLQRDPPDAGSGVDLLASLGSAGVLASPIQSVWDNGRAIHALDTKGRVYAWAIPAPTAGSAAPLIPTPPIDTALLDAAVALALNNTNRAAARLDAVESPTREVQLAQIYTATLAAGEDGAGFAKRAAAAHHKLSDPGTRADVLAFVFRLVVAQDIKHAFDLYTTWLAWAGPGDAAAGIEVGLQLADRAGDSQTSLPLVRAMQRKFPHAAEIDDYLREHADDAGSAD